MPARKSFNQLDPFAEGERFQTRGIRNSRSRSSKNPFTNVSSDDKKHSSRIVIYCIILIIVILAAVALLFLLPNSTSSDPTATDDPLVNPAGRDASSEYTDNTDDPELRASEQEKLDSMLELIAEEDWEYANATFETIFPSYLDTCGRYDYYRAAVLLADNFEGFLVSRDTAETNMNYLLERCGKSRTE